MAEFNQTHPSITVNSQFYGNSDYALQKVLAAIAGGKPPDVSYLYGSWAPNIATNPQLVPLNKFIDADPSFNWNDFFPAERKVATVGNSIIGIPALVDNLALVYNKTLFKQAGIPLPTATWTWSDFENAAIKLTNPAKKQFGWAYVNDASEDTVWRFWAMLWQAGGSILSPDGKQAGFDSAAGVKALTLLQQLTAHHSIYLDDGSDNYLSVFNNGHIGMLWTGPWDLAQIVQSKVKYGVTILPADQNHQTISGPRQLGDVQQRAGARAGGVDVPEVADLPGDRSAVGDADRRPPGPRLGVQAARLQGLHRQVPGDRRLGQQPQQRHPGAPAEHQVPEDLHGHRPSRAVRAARQGVAQARAQPGRAAGQRHPRGAGIAVRVTA